MTEKEIKHFFLFQLPTYVNDVVNEVLSNEHIGIVVIGRRSYM